MMKLAVLISGFLIILLVTMLEFILGADDRAVLMTGQMGPLAWIGVGFFLFRRR